MLNTAELQKEIIRLKKEKDVCILAHAYQTHDILEVADFTGDSFGLSVEASKTSHKNILMCGVRFMAQSVKILCPDKKVILSHPEAGCPMAEQMTPAQIRELKRLHPNAAVVAYINTTAELKNECDVCVTSASAVKIVKEMPEQEIIFIPDCNLGSFVAKNVPEKKFYFYSGGCVVHMSIRKEDVKIARKLHPNAKVLVHPECLSEVSSLADYVGSTTGIIKYVEESDEKEFVIGTDNSITQHLQFKFPQKRFYPLSKCCMCHDMRLTTLVDVYNCLLGIGGEVIELDEKVRIGAKKCIDKMLAYGG
jgi:quinolinate synthase